MVGEGAGGGGVIAAVLPVGPPTGPRGGIHELDVIAGQVVRQRRIPSEEDAVAVSRHPRKHGGIVGGGGIGQLVRRHAGVDHVDGGGEIVFPILLGFHQRIGGGQTVRGGIGVSGVRIGGHPREVEDDVLDEHRSPRGGEGPAVGDPKTAAVRGADIGGVRRNGVGGTDAVLAVVVKVHGKDVARDGGPDEVGVPGA